MDPVDQTVGEHQEQGHAQNDKNPAPESRGVHVELTIAPDFEYKQWHRGERHEGNGRAGVHDLQAHLPREKERMFHESVIENEGVAEQSHAEVQ